MSSLEFDCCYAVPGPQGSPGSQGCIGSRGPQGKVGLNMEKGERGWQGPDGPRGPQGLAIIGGAGAPGAAGSPGIRGEVGCHGNPGTQGVQGHQGDNGERGIMGPIGFPGRSGILGNQGSQGAQGVDGGQGHVGDPIDVPFSFTVEVASTGGVVDSSATISNLETLRIWTAGTSEVSLESGSILFNLNPANLISLPGDPSFTPADTSGDFMYINTSSGSMFQWDPATLGWRQKTVGRSLIGPPGVQGAQGTQGSQGAVGSLGLGLPGPQGIPVIGSQGYQGTPISGLTGAIGDSVLGAQGYQGNVVIDLASNYISVPYFMHTINGGDSSTLVLPTEYLVPGAIVEISNRSDVSGVFEAELILPPSSVILEKTNLVPDDRFYWTVISNHANNHPFRLRMTGESIFYDINGSITAPTSEVAPNTLFPPYVYYYLKADQRMTINFINYFGNLRGMIWTITHTDL